jgi:hypothetical protein
MTRISPIYTHGPAQEPTGEVADKRNHAARKAMWHKMGLAVLDPAQIADDWERQCVINLANQAYGERSK